jgi:hypothetical protein
MVHGFNHASLKARFLNLILTPSENSEGFFYADELVL